VRRGRKRKGKRKMEERTSRTLNIEHMMFNLELRDMVLVENTTWENLEPRDTVLVENMTWKI